MRVWVIVATMALCVHSASAKGFETIHEVLRHFQVAFVERANTSSLLLGALEGLTQKAPGCEVVLKGSPELFLLRAGKKRISISRGSLRDIPELEKAISKAASFALKYGEAKSKRQLEHAIVRQMVAHCGDKWSVFLESKLYLELLDDGTKEVGSTGMLVEPWKDGLRVLDVLEQTSAFKAGIKPGMVVDFIDGHPADKLNELEALALMRGAVGKKIKVVLEGKSYVLTLAKEPKRNLSVTPMKGGLAHVRIFNFRQGTGRRLKAVMKKLEQHFEGKLKGIILDLRANPGGLVTEGTEVAGLFLPKGPVVRIVSKKHTRVEQETNPGPGAYMKLPLVLMVDHRSASVSEIVTMAFRDYKRARIVGTKTLGKGTVQVILELMDGSALKLSTGRYYSPAGTPIYDGIEPDLVVPWDGNGQDIQLQKAVDLLTQMT